MFDGKKLLGRIRFNKRNKWRRFFRLIVIVEGLIDWDFGNQQ
jgi:hypothetical protein